MNTDVKTAIWALTPGGLTIAGQLSTRLNGCCVFASQNLGSLPAGTTPFDKLGPAVCRNFNKFDGHIFIMACGIAVRMIAGLLRHKTLDPAVVVVDDAARFAISLVSGHIGGANDLARSVAERTGATCVITTATDVNCVPSIDVIAKNNQLAIENPEHIKLINMAFLKDQKIFLDDPYGLIKDQIFESYLETQYPVESRMPVIKVHDTVSDKTDNTLFLRPKTLSVGIGCNRGASLEEIRALFFNVCEKQRLCVLSVKQIATIDIKKNETGILELAEQLGIPIVFFDSETLDRVKTIKNPSMYAKKYTGAKSVCEAAAIKASGQGQLIVSKKKTKNVTLAIARHKIICTSSG